MSSRAARTVFVLGAAAALGAGRLLELTAQPLPPLSGLPSTPYVLQDASLAAAGFRAAAADLAWVQLLQYAANNLADMPPDRPGRPYDHLLDMSLRVVRLDPGFRRAYLFGTGILGWFRDVERPDEAMTLLREGIRNEPADPVFKVYLAALAYKLKGNDARMLALLDAAFDDPETPTHMRTILASLYKARGDYAHSLELWLRILDNPRDEAEHPRAAGQVRLLEGLLQKQGPARESRAGPAPEKGSN